MIQWKHIVIASTIIMVILLIVTYPKAKPHVTRCLYKYRVVNKDAQKISTDLNDHLRVEYQRPSGATIDVHKHIEVYCDICDHPLLALYLKYDEVELRKQSFTCIYKSKYMRAYEYTDKTNQTTSIFWVSNNHAFCAGRMFGLTDLSRRLYGGDEVIKTQFYPFVKHMLMSKKWEWYEGFADVIVKSGDNEGIDIVKRYAEGRFSEEEQRINKRTTITRDEVIEYSKQILNNAHVRFIER